MIRKRILSLGGGQGWHTTQLSEAASRLRCDIEASDYGTMSASFYNGQLDVLCGAGRLSEFDVVLTRTMPAGSFERITFRLGMLHEMHEHVVKQRKVFHPPSADRRLPNIINPPRSLEIAIDKFSTLNRVAGKGYQVPKTIITQNRAEAMDAFKQLGEDCVVKPIFGGEGRGIMRIKDTEQAWYVFSSLDQFDAVFYVQQFLPPGGVDHRILVIGDEVLGIKRKNLNDFRANVAGGGKCERLTISDERRTMAVSICKEIGLVYGAVDYLEMDDGTPCVIEVNAIPGWKGAQTVTPFSIAELIVSTLLSSTDTGR